MDCIDTDAIHLSNIPHHIIYGRVDGFTRPGPRAVLRPGLIFVARVGGFENPQPVGKIIRINARAHLGRTDIIPDIRRGNSSLGSLAQFLAKTPATLHGLR